MSVGAFGIILESPLLVMEYIKVKIKGERWD